MTYNPNLGRWLQVDPTGFDGGDANLYRMEGNNPTNEVDPSGLLGKVTTIKFTFYGFSEEQQKELMDITVKAVEKLEKALAMLTDHWDELEDLATVKSVPRPFLDKTYQTLKGKIRDVSAIGAPVGCGCVHNREVIVRQQYIDKIKSIISQINKGDHIGFKQVGKSGVERAAYITYFFYPHGKKIRITPLFWDLVDSRKLSDIIRELGRREGFDQTNTQNPLYDVQVWEDTIEYLARKYDELMAKKNKP